MRKEINIAACRIVKMLADNSQMSYFLFICVQRSIVSEPAQSFCLHEDDTILLKAAAFLLTYVEHRHST